MARLEYAAVEDLSAVAASEFKRLPPLSVLRMVAHADAVGACFATLGLEMLTRLRVTPAERELAVVVVGGLMGSTYVLDHHCKIAESVGLRPDVVAGAARGSDCHDGLTRREEALVLLAGAVARGCRLSDEEFGVVSSVLDSAEIVEVILTAGYYRTVSLLDLLLQLDPDT